ncbi:MAG: KpsF/GutQ family sugar-phosphate isomerase [SAR324 cluster bacterium]|nr:KpsF/GutQ family sugar-phosphate isomerase [SAR324 cluster bacterium]
MSPVLQRAKETLLIEIEGIQGLLDRLDDHFEEAIHLLFACKGKVVVTGMGKSGLIGQKIASTLTSTGTPAIFLHPADSYHGDLGIITDQDVLVAISFSGETQEIVQMLGHIHAIGVPCIGMTGQVNSTLATNSTIHLNISVDKEACPLGLAPTTSTTVTLALGDAMAMCLLEKRNFQAEDFAVFHPGGSLGKKLTITVGDLMSSGERLPLVDENTSVHQTVHELSEKLLGIVMILNSSGQVTGVFTVGDLMRLIEQRIEFLHEPIAKFMTRNPRMVNAEILAAKALHTMQTHSITCLVVGNENKKPVGIVQIYDILRAGVY